MRMNWILSTAFVALFGSAAVAAQSGKDMDKPSTSDKMTMTYTGCVEVVNHGGTFLLTHVGEARTPSMHGDMTMKSDADMMNKDQTTMDDAKMDAMASRTIVLSGSGLNKHVGQKVAVTGLLSDGSMRAARQDLSTLTVKTLKVVAKSCSRPVRP